MVVAMRVGVLTGGGDCPGLNAVIRAVVRKGVQEYGLEFVGFRDGWRGPLEGDTVPLDVQAVRGILPRGGTPTAFDRVLATRFGVHAVQAVHDEAFGVMMALRGTDIIRVPLVEATSQLKLVPPQRYAEAEVFFG